MERLASLETNPNIHYHPVFVGEETKAIDHSSNNSTKNEHQQVINRLATIKAKKLANYNQIKEQFNSGQKIVLSNDMIRLDEFIDKSQHFDIDFLKVDTDGHDINVLRGASSIINSGGMIGLDVEVRFIGPQNNHANIFRNVDKMLSDAGFSLFHLEPKKILKILDASSLYEGQTKYISSRPGSVGEFYLLKGSGRPWCDSSSATG